MNTCKTCTYWKKQPPRGSWIASVVSEGLCGRIFEGSRQEGAAAETFNHHGDDSGLMTAPDFGCLHFERE